jgi:hypothetical protein
VLDCATASCGREADVHVLIDHLRQVQVQGEEGVGGFRVIVVGRIWRYGHLQFPSFAVILDPHLDVSRQQAHLEIGPNIQRSSQIFQTVTKLQEMM